MLKKYIYIFLISMVPVIELRGAVPIGVAMELPWCWVLIVSIIGNMVPVPFIIYFIRYIIKWMHGKKHLDSFARWLDGKVEKHRGQIEKYAWWGLFIFVAIPLPGTGAWTGSLIAGMIDMPKKKAVASIFLGVVGAGLIMTFGSKIVEWIISIF